jgi:hypothetical protein
VNCRNVAHNLTELNEGHLSFWQRFTLRAHMAICPSCKVYVRQMEDTTRVLGESKETLSDDASRAIAERAMRANRPT